MMKKLSGTKSPIALRRVLTTAAVLLLFALVFAAPAAAADPVTTEDELKNALSEGGTVTLGSNIALSQGFTIAKETIVILDLAGYTLSFNSDVAGTSFVIDNKGTLTIKDSTAPEDGIGTGKITSAATQPDGQEIPGYASNTIRNYGSLTLESGIIENTAEGGAACYPIDTSSNGVSPSLTINGGKVVSANTNAIRMHCNSANHENTLIINGGVMEGTYAIWIHLAGSTNDVTHPATLKINGGTLTGTGTSGLAIYSYSYGNAYNGVDISITDGTIVGDVAVGGGSAKGGQGAETVTITGGSITDVYTYNKGAENIAISGGIFDYEPYDYCLAEDYNTVETAGGKWIVGYPLPELTQKTVTYTGEVNPYVLPEGLSGYETSYSLNGEVVTPVNVGTYNVTVYHVATDSTDKYYAETLTDGLVIEPAPLTATYAGETIAYGATPDLFVAVTGWQNGEDKSLPGYVAPTLSNNNETVGSYELTPSGGSAPNYKFAYVSGFLTITAVEPTIYAITIEEGIQHGAITADKTTAAEGETVTITAVPENGYRFSEISLTVDGSTPAEPATLSGNTATFKMPAKAVTVSAIFTKITSDEGEDTETGDAETPGTTEPEVPGTIDNVNGNTATIAPPSATSGEQVIETSDDKKTTTIDAGNGVSIVLTSTNPVTTEADGSVTGTFNTVEAVYEDIPAALKGSQTPVSYGLTIPMNPAKSLGAGIPLPKIDATFKENVANKVAGHNGNSYNSLAMIEATYTGGIDIINNNLSGEVTVTFKLPANVGQKLVVFHVKDGQPPQLVSNVRVSDPVNGFITVTAKGDGFSSYIVAQDTTPTSSGSSTTQGSSVWLTETQTPTQTPSAQPTPTDVAPTDIQSTQPTPTQTESPGFGILGVLAGLGAVAVLRRK